MNMMYIYIYVYIYTHITLICMYRNICGKMKTTSLFSPKPSNQGLLTGKSFPFMARFRFANFSNLPRPCTLWLALVTYNQCNQARCVGNFLLVFRAISLDLERHTLHSTRRNVWLKHDQSPINSTRVCGMSALRLHRWSDTRVWHVMSCYFAWCFVYQRFSPLR